MKLFLWVGMILPLYAFSFTFLDTVTKRSIFIEQATFLLKEKGKWRAENPDYRKSDEWSVAYYGYEFEKGIEASILKLRITGYIPQKSFKVLFWDGFYYWDNGKQQVAYISMNIDGLLAQGISDSLSNSSLTLLLSLTNKNGKVEYHRDSHFLEKDQIISRSYKWESGRWIKNNEMQWRRQ
jgi:hypothetical protein